ncbi:hypothetical protein [Sphingomonas gilva]|nr:hypothetical protein [Sphingomonas gilva]
MALHLAIMKKEVARPKKGLQLCGQGQAAAEQSNSHQIPGDTTISAPP